jgi:hypothetical protein
MSEESQTEKNFPNWDNYSSQNAVVQINDNLRLMVLLYR